MNFRFSDHAKEEVKRRRITIDMVNSVLDNPEQVLQVEMGREVYQSKIDFGAGKIYLVRVIVEDCNDEPVVVTVYRTSKINKYWSQG